MPKRPAVRNLRWLNSLRALGVVLVLVYHAFPQALPGGFIGVDIFFVVSGYLITALLLKEQHGEGRIHLIAFWVRRWRRLFPAMLAMVLLALSLALAVSPDFRVDGLRQAAAALSWTTNYYEIASGGSYEAQLLPHLFIHTWTLAVEMQYYLVWALVVVLISRVATVLRNKSKQGGGGGLTGGSPVQRPELTVLAAAGLALLLASYIYMNISVSAGGDPSAAYMGTLSHAFPLMCGSVAACIGGFSPRRRFVCIARLRWFKPVSLTLAALAAAAEVALSFLLDFDAASTYHWGILASALLTALLILIAALWQEISEHKEWAVSNYLGIRSYSIYLFHWPLIVIARAWLQQVGVGRDLAPLLGGALAIPLTLAAAELCYRFVESRFRIHRDKQLAREAGAFEIPHSRPDSGPLRATLQTTGKAANPADPQKVRRRGGTILLNIATALIGVALAGLAVYALATTPLYSSIEARLDSGKMAIDVSNLPDPGGAS
ncbi:MAG: acyltransferase [Coriobacteriales bacterium]|jgi:peptidoglycan/LPS O-acetylase OafA/YrhL|nr:acyltransferase [Coriobacteriales bacterium]